MKSERLSSAEVVFFHISVPFFKAALGTLVGHKWQTEVTVDFKG